MRLIVFHGDQVLCESVLCAPRSWSCQLKFAFVVSTALILSAFQPRQIRATYQELWTVRAREKHAWSSENRSSRPQVSVKCCNELLLHRHSNPLRGKVPEAHQNAWQTVRPHFVPPEQWQGKFGKYTSPLRFVDGTMVKTPADWKRRRAELMEKWSRLLGKWPKLIEQPDVSTLAMTRHKDFTQHTIRFAWTPNELTTGYLLIPHSKGPHPAVVTVFYEPETAIGKGKPHRDFALQLAKRGFVTLSIGTTQASRDKTYALYYPDITQATVQPLSMLGYAAANAWHVLANHPKVDSTRIGIVGHSFGGKWAMFASCLFDRFACAAWSDPGIVFDDSRSSVNYWEPWYLGYHSKPWRKRGLITDDNPARGLYPQLVKGKHDLHELHALMAPRPFLVSGGSEDPASRWEALNHSVQVNRILGFENRVAMANRPQHSPDEDSNKVIYAFFEHFLRPEID